MDRGHFPRPYFEHGLFLLQLDFEKITGHTKFALLGAMTKHTGQMTKASWNSFFNKVLSKSFQTILDIAPGSTMRRQLGFEVLKGNYRTGEINVAGEVAEDGAARRPEEDARRAVKDVTMRDTSHKDTMESHKFSEEVHHYKANPQHQHTNNRIPPLKITVITQPGITQTFEKSK